MNKEYEAIKRHLQTPRTTRMDWRTHWRLWCKQLAAHGIPGELCWDAWRQYLGGRLSGDAVQLTPLFYPWSAGHHDKRWKETPQSPSPHRYKIL